MRSETDFYAAMCVTLMQRTTDLTKLPKLAIAIFKYQIYLFMKFSHLRKRIFLRSERYEPLKSRAVLIILE